MTQKILAQGAEAIIYLVEQPNKKRGGKNSPPLGGRIGTGRLIIKDRISKSYRIKELDDKIRKSRTKSEKKLLKKASKIINAPDPFPLERVVGACGGGTVQSKIYMPFIDGKKLSENLDSFSLNKQKEICRIIGQEIAKLHEADIIHGDLTTSNMILVDKLEECDFEQNTKLKRSDNNSLSSGREGVLPVVYFIDFGLGYISKKIEDKAVDLHLLKQALEAKHFKNWKELFESVKKGYESINKKEAQKVLERFKAVEKRGRYKER